MSSPAAGGLTPGRSRRSRRRRKSFLWMSATRHSAQSSVWTCCRTRRSAIITSAAIPAFLPQSSNRTFWIFSGSVSASSCLWIKYPVSAAVNEAVEQTKRSGSRAAGLVNAVLRRVAENRENLPEIPNIGTAQELSVRFSHPLWLCERMVSELGMTGRTPFFAASNRAPQLTVSVNTRYGDAPSLVERFSSAGVRAHVSELSSVSVCVEDKGSAAALPRLCCGRVLCAGCCRSDECFVRRAEKGMRVLDACSAPGGKSLLCASLMENDGEILACDLHEKSSRLVEENAERLRFFHHPHCADGRFQAV